MVKTSSIIRAEIEWESRHPDKWMIVNEDFSCSEVDWSKNPKKYKEEIEKWERMKKSLKGINALRH